MSTKPRAPRKPRQKTLVNALTVACPIKKCLAPINEPCFDLDTFRNKEPRVLPHTSRITAAAKAVQDAKPGKDFKRPKLGKMPARNFAVDLHLGVCEPADESGEIPLKKLDRRFRGRREKLAGFDLELYQRSAADKTGAVRVAWIEARADSTGRLTMKIFTLKRGKVVKVLDSTSYRYGSPVEAALPKLPKEIERGEDSKINGRILVEESNG
jgi:hypothetical protein